MVEPTHASGDVTLNPTFAAVGTPKTFRVTYTALTDLTDATLRITPMGIVIDNPATTAVTETALSTTSGYGYVRAGTIRAASGNASKDDLSVTGTMIEWGDLNLKGPTGSKKGESVEIVIGPVNVMSRAGKETWIVELANNTPTIGTDSRLMDVDSGTDG